ncbi:GDSL esterase/lipase At5g03610-like [Camellia sinensis]|uniref:GDSL esterase/lipase At5g03610-like n=1 Tax=Camellia sinensis TaxID=4442 RepID=UPI0010362ECC|nr:GDSL esterase/lipase At5g03610-like [Camellia sinensis]
MRHRNEKEKAQRRKIFYFQCGCSKFHTNGFIEPHPLEREDAVRGFLRHFEEPNVVQSRRHVHARESGGIQDRMPIQLQPPESTGSPNVHRDNSKEEALALDLPSFISAVVDQLAENLKRIQDIGVRKVAVTAMQPLGCLPRSTVLNSFQECNATENTAVTFHNLLLQQAVSKLNNNSKDSSAFVILDLYGSFISVLKTKGNFLGSVKFETPLKPCCMGTSSGHYCGSLDEKGAKMYAVCNNPEAAFFWDMVHPTQAGWRAVYLALKSTLQKIN